MEAGHPPQIAERLLAVGAQFVIGLLPLDVHQLDDNAPDAAAIGATMRQQTHQVLATVSRRRFTFHRHRAVENRPAIALRDRRRVGSW